ncbi:MAG: hypothetical protein ACTSR8_13770 [Promethearchaeota archaeon]
MESTETHPTVKVIHNLKRQILEIPSLFRVINNYYNKKSEIQKQIRPLIQKKFKEGLKTLEKDQNWLFSLPTALTTLNEDFVKKKDSFRFPDSIILFEAWMNLGYQALFPRVALHFKFPGLLKGEKNRNVFQFIYATSRGFGFPIYFGPEFYEYHITIGKIIQPIFKWVYTLCHKVNQGIYLVGDKKLNAKRHHPGEFESVIISEYVNKAFKGIDTLLHGYFTPEPKYLGIFNNLQEALKNVMFSYTIGDHAMSVEKSIDLYTLKVPLITYDVIVNKYDVDFYSYIKKIIHINVLLNKKIAFYKRKRKNLIIKMSWKDRILFRLNQSIPRRRDISNKFSEIVKLSNYKHLLEKLRDLMWTSPLYTHTLHFPTKEERDKTTALFVDFAEEFERDSIDSNLLTFIKQYEIEHDIVFEEEEVIRELKSLRDQMAKMWLYFKERHFKYAVKKLGEISSLSLNDPNYKKKINNYLDKLIPIISIYEIFHRPLSESVYPESIPQTKRLGSYLARFLTSKYNPMGINIMNIFNRLAYRSWIYLIIKRKLNRMNFFYLVLKLPIWKGIPPEVKKRILI